MVQLLARGCFKWHLRVQMIFAIFQVCVAGSNSTTFQFGSSGPHHDVILHANNHINGSNVTCLGDFKYQPARYFQDHRGHSGRLQLKPQPCRDASNYSGRCLYTNPVNLLTPTSKSNEAAVTSFSTMFQVSIIPQSDYAYGINSSDSGLQGIAFIITNNTSAVGDGGGYLGWLSSTTNGQLGYNFAVELDFFRDVEFADPVGVHVGVNVNDMTSKVTAPSTGLENALSSEYFSNMSGMVTVWIEYEGLEQILNVSISRSATENYSRVKPLEPLISTHVDLTDVFQQRMFVGFSGSFSKSSTNNAEYDIRLWTFNSDGPPPDYRRKADGTIYVGKSIWKRIRIALIVVPFGIIFFLLTSAIYVLHHRNVRLNAIARMYQLQELELHYPQSFKYEALRASTRGFSPKQMLGEGGFGCVYRGSLRLNRAKGVTEVAVKRCMLETNSEQGESEFLAEVKIIGQTQHRNLVRLLGWCHEKGQLLLVYDYMPNGSLDQHLFKDEPDDKGWGVLQLTWARRLKIVSGVAMALAYLHEDWEQQVIHRDVKSSNVMLDTNFNARLGDFGLARAFAHGQASANTTIVAGTRGYMAPELGYTQKATVKTDVYSFGTLVLETATGRRPVFPKEEQSMHGTTLLTEWVWSLYGHGRILEAADVRLQNSSDSGEMETMLKIGLLCCHPNPDERPTMREALNIWEGCIPFPFLPRNKPVPTFETNRNYFDSDSDIELISSQMKHYISSEDDWQHNAVKTSYDRPVVSLELTAGVSSSEDLRSRRWRSTPLPT